MANQSKLSELISNKKCAITVIPEKLIGKIINRMKVVSFQGKLLLIDIFFVITENAIRAMSVRNIWVVMILFYLAHIIINNFFTKK
jgi:hypothetical protein